MQFFFCFTHWHAVELPKDDRHLLLQFSPSPVSVGQFWRLGLPSLEALDAIDWSWLLLDGSITKAPLGGGKIGANPTDRAKGGVKRSLLTEANGIPVALAIDGANRHDMYWGHSPLYLSNFINLLQRV